MKLDLNDDALEFGQVVRDALGSAGGDELIVEAEKHPAAGEKIVGDVCGQLGAWDLDVRGSGDELEAAAAVSRASGWWASPGAVAERLARPTDLEPQVDAVALVGPPRPSAPVHGSALRWSAVDLDGNRSHLTDRPLPTTPRKATFVAEVDLTPIEGSEPGAGVDDAVLSLVLSGWRLLGMLDRTVDLTIGYVQDRHQFGKPLSAFQSVQFQLTEAEVERAGVEELAKYALWSFAQRHDDAMVDALALRLAGLEAADKVLRICHQLHGAIGFCDETMISWISRYSRPIRMLPLPLSGTRAELTRRAGGAGLSGLYSPA